MIKIEHLSKSFDNNGQPNELFHELNFEVKEGEFLTILGPNGCGKSTLLNIISGVEKVYRGRVIIAGNHKNRSETVAYMLQRDLLLPWLNVTENINLGLEVQKRNSPETDKKIQEYLEVLNIAHLQKAYPSNLSGGERQKIALIRTLILSTPILLLDEPFSAIDYNTRLELQRTIFDYANQNGTTVILITHDIDEAIAVSDRILIFDYKPEGIKLDFPLNLNVPDRDPVTTRKDPAFSIYYDLIWQNYPK